MAVIIEDNGDPDNLDIDRDIVIRSRQGPLQRISQNNPDYLPLQYVVLFPYGTRGWHPNLMTNEVSGKGGKLKNVGKHNHHFPQRLTINSMLQARPRKISPMMYFAYRLHTRAGETSVHAAKNLFQQLIVDFYIIMEWCRLQYLKFNQNAIRADIYRGVADALNARDHQAEHDDGAEREILGANLGTRVILPASYTGVFT